MIVTAHVIVLANHQADTFRNRMRHFRRGIHQQERKLFTANPCGDVVLAYGVLQDIGDKLNDLVALQMSISVVDTLEVIEIADDNRDRLAIGDSG